MPQPYPIPIQYNTYKQKKMEFRDLMGCITLCMVLLAMAFYNCNADATPPYNASTPSSTPYHHAPTPSPNPYNAPTPSENSNDHHEFKQSDVMSPAEPSMAPPPHRKIAPAYTPPPQASAPCPLY